MLRNTPFAARPKDRPEKDSADKKPSATTGPLSGPVTGHAAASLNQDGSTKVRRLDKGLDPMTPLKTKKNTPPARNPFQDARSMEAKARKINAPKPRNAQQDARDMKGKAKGTNVPKQGNEQQKSADDAYRAAREWLARHGNEKAKKEMEPAAEAVWDGTKWIVKQALWKGAEVLTDRHFSTLLARGVAGLSTLGTIFGEWIDPPLAHAPTLEDDFGEEKKPQK